jgi:hypothetical protein
MDTQEILRELTSAGIPIQRIEIRPTDGYPHLVFSQEASATDKERGLAMFHDLVARSQIREGLERLRQWCTHIESVLNTAKEGDLTVIVKKLQTFW